MNGTGTFLEFTNETDTTYTGGTNINLNGTAINLYTDLTNLNSINTYKINGNATSEITLLRNNNNLFNGDYLKINSTGKVIGQNIVDTKKAILGTDNTSGILVGSNMSKTVDTLNGNGNITLNSTDTTYTGGTNISISGTAVNLDSTITLDRLNITQGNSIFLKGNNDENHFIKYVLDGIEVGGFGSNSGICFQVVNTKPLLDTPAGTPISVFQVYRDKVISKQKLEMTSQPIFFKNDIYHYIKYQTTGDCIEIGSYSNLDDSDAVFKFVNTFNSELLVSLNKNNNSIIKDTYFESDIIIKNAKKLIFNDSSVVPQSNYIKHNDTYDSMEISGSGLGTGSSVLRIVSVNSTPDVLADFELTKTTFEKTTHFNNDIQMLSEKKLSFDIDILNNNSWIKATTEDSQDGLHINGTTGIKLSTGTYTSELFLNQDTLEISTNLTTFDNDITATFCDISLDGDFVGTDCDLTIDGDMRVGQDLNMRDNTNLGQINMSDGPIYWRNGYKTGENTYATDTNHYSQYNGFPVDGIRHQGWNGVALGYTNGGPGTALYTSGTVVRLGNGNTVTSDDRIKFNETRIINALSTINKLVVMEYDKKYNRELYETQYEEEMENHLLNDTAKKEYGYIAQDTWNNIPELRFTIDGVDTTIPENFDANGLLIEDCKIRNKNQQGVEFIDRKYLSLDYNNINVLNVKAVQELSEIVKQQQIIIDKLINSTTFANFKKNI
jgi:hypothetical protein